MSERVEVMGTRRCAPFRAAAPPRPRSIGARGLVTSGFGVAASQGVGDGFVPDWGHLEGLKKVKVALHVGYDGSPFRGGAGVRREAACRRARGVRVPKPGSALTS